MQSVMQCVHGAWMHAWQLVRAAFLHALFAPTHICTANASQLFAPTHICTANASQRNMERLASSTNPASTQVDFTTQHLIMHNTPSAAVQHTCTLNCSIDHMHDLTSTSCMRDHTLHSQSMCKRLRGCSTARLALSIGEARARQGVCKGTLQTHLFTDQHSGPTRSCSAGLEG
jgi:hypothetical protein